MTPTKQDNQKVRKKIKGMSEEFYDYGTLTKHDFDNILDNQKIIDSLEEVDICQRTERRIHSG